MFQFRSKSKTLSILASKNLKFIIPKFINFNFINWKNNKKEILNAANNFSCKYLIIRSSSITEDGKNNSNAGKFLSINNIHKTNKLKIEKAVNKVFQSFYKEKKSFLSEVIIQESIKDAVVSGVIFTHDFNTGAPYYVINYDDETDRTDNVTSGKSKYSNRTLNILRNKTKNIKSHRWKKLIDCTQELEKVVNSKYLDIEFCLTKNLNCYLFQVRPITTLNEVDQKLQKKTFNQINSIKQIIKKKYLYKKKDKLNTVFAQMSDWNPAEMIGQIAKPLSISLYKKLITNSVWSEGREKMGYYKPHNQNLMEVFCNSPYINTRLSFESFTPSSLNKKLREKIVKLNLKKLMENPNLHDKIEFDVAITCFSFDIEKKINQQLKSQFSSSEKKDICESFLQMTQSLLHSKNQTSIENQLKLIKKLDQFNKALNVKNIKEIKHIIQMCKKYGTLPFSILARHGFIAKTLVLSLVDMKILTKNDYNQIFQSIKTVATEFSEDISKLSKKKISKNFFLLKYGHLRPGTYDINAQSYREMNNFYNIKKPYVKQKIRSFSLSKNKETKIKKLLDKFQLFDSDVKSFFNYITEATKAREHGKFVFTKSISIILDSLKKNYKNIVKNKDDLSYLTIDELTKYQSTKKNIAILKKKIEKQKNIFNLNKLIKLPSVMTDIASIFIIPFQINNPNYITDKKVVSDIIEINVTSNFKKFKQKIKNKIVFIESADPGFDWIFSCKILGLITKYGGANSHMSIRCAEFNLAAAIGCGEQIYSKISKAKRVSLDCQSKKIEILN